MFEAKLIQGSLLKRVLETVKNLSNKATLVCSKEGIQLEAMDHYQVSLMNVIIRADSFAKFQCDRSHTHIILTNGRASVCQVYPRKFCAQLFLGLKDELNKNRA